MSDPLLEYFRDPGAAVYNGTQHDPDQFARDKQLAEKHGVPRETVSNNLVEFQRRDKLNSVNINELKQSSPKLADFFSNQDNVAQSHDDIENLSALERSIAAYRSPERGIINNSLRGAATRAFDGGGYLLRFIGNVARMGEEGLIELTGINPGIQFNDDGISWTWNLPKDELVNVIVETGEDISEFGEEYFDYVPEFTWEKFKGEMTVENLAGYIIEQGGQSLSDMAAAVFTLPAYVAWRAEEIAEARVEADERQIVEEKDLATALPVAVTVSFLERIGALGVFKVGGVTGVKTAAQEIGKATLREASTEFVQEQLEYAGETVGTKRGFNLATMLDRGLAGAVAGGGMGGAVRTTTATYEGVKFGRETKKINESRQESQILDEITQKAQESKLNSRNNKLFQDYVKSLGDQNIYIDPEALVENYDGANEEILAKVEEALNLGTDVIVPLELYAAEIASQSNIESIKPYVRMSEDSLSQSEMEGVDPQGLMRDLVQSVQDNEEVLGEAEKIFEDVKDQLIQTGRLAPQHADKAATLIPAYVSTKVKELKSRGIEVTPEEIYRDMGLTIEKKEIVDEGLLQEAPAKFDNAAGNFNPELDDYWIKYWKLEVQDPSLSDEEYNLTVAENANQSRIEDILEGIGFERSGGSNISMSSYYRKEVGIGEYDPEHDEHEDYEVYEIRVSDHEDRHPPSDDVKDRINVGFRGGVSGWSDLDLGPDVISVKIKNEILGALPSEAIRDIDMPDEAERVRALKSIEVTTTDIIEETGESVEITETAFDAMDRIDTRLRDLESMLDCLK